MASKSSLMALASKANGNSIVRNMGPIFGLMVLNTQEISMGRC